jgi:hypothetical protein
MAVLLAADVALSSRDGHGRADGRARCDPDNDVPGNSTSLGDCRYSGRSVKPVFGQATPWSASAAGVPPLCRSELYETFDGPQSRPHRAHGDGLVTTRGATTRLLARTGTGAVRATRDVIGSHPGAHWLCSGTIRSSNREQPTTNPGGSGGRRSTRPATGSWPLP